ncbi:MAG: dihydrodipicolinate synthase family protein [Caldilineaceae bacterium]
MAAAGFQPAVGDYRIFHQRVHLVTRSPFQQPNETCRKPSFYAKGKNHVRESWSGVFAATLCPFREDQSIDEEGLRAYSRYLAGVEGMRGLVCNGHTGEVMGLRARERAEVTGIMADEVGHQVKIISGVCCDGSFEAIDHALEAKEAGADAILLMPPHHWLRFGRTPETAVGYFQDVAEGARIPIIVHQYPDWTKASYSLKELTEIACRPRWWRSRWAAATFAAGA